MNIDLSISVACHLAFSFSVFRHFQVEFSDLFPKGIAMDIQPLGCLRLVPADLLQGTLDMEFLYFVK
jgi:hypothetical protein